LRTVAEPGLLARAGEGDLTVGGSDGVGDPRGAQRADQQRRRASAAACSDLAEAVVRHAVSVGQPVRGANANRDRDLPPPKSRCFRMARPNR